MTISEASKTYTEKEENLKKIKDILTNDIGINGIVFSPIFGNLNFLGEDKNGLKFESVESHSIVYFQEDGTFAKGGEQLLFPSKTEHD